MVCHEPSANSTLQRVGADTVKLPHPMKRMLVHRAIVAGSHWQRPAVRSAAAPIRLESGEVRPRFDKTALHTRQIPGDEVAGSRLTHRRVPGIRVEVRRVMYGACFHEHADDDAEESADFGHDRLILRPGTRPTTD